MVGGGPGAFIGDVHRRAMRMDGLATLVAGVFSSDPAKSRAHAATLGVERAYGSFEEMAEAEAQREDGIDVVSIVTPNWLHFPAAMAFIERGITKIRLTGGEPLVRRDMIDLVRALGRKLGDGLEELPLPPNGTRLAEFAGPLADAGVKRVNVSLDTLDPA
ncbi:MAG: hypothetical protein CMM84_00205, partial [Rhodothermaceae bacterium]|nr:hypothetical protein [Rhodothermaceae bacterium]